MDIKQDDSEWPLSHEFKREDDGTTIDYGYFAEDKQSDFKTLFQHLSDIEIQYDAFVVLDEHLFNGRTYKWKIKQQYDTSAHA